MIHIALILRRVHAMQDRENGQEIRRWRKILDDESCAAYCDHMETLYGIGVDIVNIPRIEAMLQRWGVKFLQRAFTEAERRYCDGKTSPAPHYAARFAAKEAVFKALGSGWTGGVTWHDVEVRNHPQTSRPDVVLSGKCLDALAEFSAYRVLISLSHDTDYAIAQAMILATISNIPASS